MGGYGIRNSYPHGINRLTPRYNVFTAAGRIVFGPSRTSAVSRTGEGRGLPPNIIISFLSVKVQ
jgi:hypothetical protein